MQVTSLLCQDEHEHGPDCGCGHDHEHSVVHLWQAVLGVVCVLNAFIVDWFFEAGTPLASASAMIGAIILIYPIVVTAARENRHKLVQDALGDQNRILSAAGAQAVAITNSAETARNRYVTSIQSESEAFVKLLPQYQSNPQLYAQLELAKAMPQILSNVDKDFLPQRADGKPRELRLMLNREPPQNARSAANP